MSDYLIDKFAGCLLGGAIGDALGQPYEGVQSHTEFSVPEEANVSDDTQLTLATCEAIVETGKVDPESIAESMCRWYRERRISGIGASTLKALQELDAGGHWALVGRKGDKAAGNGAAMRMAPLGLLLDPRNQNDRTLIRDVSRITHHNEEAYAGALAVAMAVRTAAYGRDSFKHRFLSSVKDYLPDTKLKDRLLVLEELPREFSIRGLADRFGTSGYVVESVPFAISIATYLWRVDFKQLLISLIECGGDADTNASIFGNVVGAALGLRGLPKDFLNLLSNQEDIDHIVLKLVETTTRPYTKNELLSVTEQDSPTRGIFSEKDRLWIPQFSEISVSEEQRLRKLPKLKAMQTIEKRLSCPKRWAKIWALLDSSYQEAETLCSHCGQPLRTSEAKQCLSCGADWH